MRRNRDVQGMHRLKLCLNILNRVFEIVRFDLMCKYREKQPVDTSFRSQIVQVHPYPIVNHLILWH